MRRLLHASGLRYRTNFALLPSRRRVTGDIVFTRLRIAVFIDGCYWHGCPKHYVEPKANAEYWRPKIAANVARDSEVSIELEAAGWHVMRFWEHVEARTVADSVSAAVHHRRNEAIRNSGGIPRP